MHSLFSPCTHVLTHLPARACPSPRASFTQRCLPHVARAARVFRGTGVSMSSAVAAWKAVCATPHALLALQHHHVVGARLTTRSWVRRDGSASGRDTTPDDEDPSLAMPAERGRTPSSLWATPSVILIIIQPHVALQCLSVIERMRPCPLASACMQCLSVIKTTRPCALVSACMQCPAPFSPSESAPHYRKKTIEPLTKMSLCEM